MDERSWVFFAVAANETCPRKAVASRLAEREPVVIVERAVSAIRSPGQWRLGHRVAGRVYRPFHWPQRLPFVEPTVERWNIARLRRDLDRLLPPVPRIVCYDTPTQNRYVGQLNEDRRVYLSVDDRTVKINGAPIPGRLDAELDLLRRIDAVVCVSDRLRATLRDRLPPGRETPIHVFENFYDERLFDADRPPAIPAEAMALPRPWTLVAGFLSERIDWEGIAGCRSRRPDVHWAFVGPADAGMLERVRMIGGHYFPARPVSEIPGWIAAANACAIPYRLNAFTRASCPSKAYEYLAMGAPTLSTRVPALERYEGALTFTPVGDAASYVDAISRLLAEGRAPAAVARRRRSVAHASLGSLVHRFASAAVGEREPAIVTR